MAQYYNPIQTQVQRAPQMDMRNVNQAVGGLTSTLENIQEQRRKDSILQEQRKQQAFQNQISQEALTLTKAAGEREAEKYNRDVSEEDALRTYTQQLNISGQDSYNSSPQQQIAMLKSIPMPEGKYNPSSLITAQEKAIAAPQKILDIEVAAKAEEQIRQQKFKDDMRLAGFKESIKKMKPSAKVDEYNRLLSGGMPPAKAQLLVWGDGRSELDKNGKIFSMDPKAIKEFNLDLFGSGDTQKVINVGQKLQDSFGLKTPEVTALLHQSTGGIVDKSLETDNLAEALKSSGLVKNSYYKDAKTGHTKAMTGTMMAEALQNPDIVIRTNSDGSRVFVDEYKEREKLRKLNAFNRPSVTVDNVDTTSTSPLGHYPELMP